MKRSFFSILIIGLLAGCGAADLDGMILEVTENKVLLSKNLSLDEYEEIKNEPVSKIQKEDVLGERESLGLITLTYNHTEELRKGDKVEVWIDGDILDSYPLQAKVKKIVVKQ